MNTILGLTCISEELKDIDKKKYSFQTMTRKRFNDLCKTEDRNEALRQLSERILHNCCVTSAILHHCFKSDIGHYRLSSNLCPLVTDETLEIDFEELPDIEAIKQEFRHIGILSKTLNISMGSHPDQFCVLASLNQDAVRRTIIELNFQAKIFDMIGLPRDHTAPMNIHVNASPTPIVGAEMMITSEQIHKLKIKQLAERFYENLQKCDEGVRNRLTIENEDKSFFNVDNCLQFSEYLFEKYQYNLPVVHDNLHDNCNPSEEKNIIRNAERCAYTWVNQGEGDNNFISPVFHWSFGKPENPRAHADYAPPHNSYPPVIAIDPNYPAKFEIELKAKCKAIRLLQKQMHDTTRN
jgi:UV DNA damage repair endonuclease